MSRQSFNPDDNLPALRNKLNSNFVELYDGKVEKVPGKGLSEFDFNSARKSKLDGIQAGATSNSPDAHLLDRSNHTGTQPTSSIEGLDERLEVVGGVRRTEQTIADPGADLNILAADQMTRVLVTYPGAVDLYLKATGLTGDIRLTLLIEGVHNVSIIGGDIALTITAAMLSEGVNTLTLYATKWRDGMQLENYVWSVLSHSYGPEKLVGDGSALTFSDAERARDNLGASSGVWPVSLGGTGKATAPYVEVTKNGDQQITSAGVWVPISGWTKASDTDGCWSGDEFIAPDARRWDFRCSLTHDNIGADTIYMSLWKWNGSAFVEVRRISALTNVLLSGASAVLNLAAGDRIKLYVQISGGAPKWIYGNSVASVITVTPALT